MSTARSLAFLSLCGALCGLVAGLLMMNGGRTHA